MDELGRGNVNAARRCARVQRLGTRPEPSCRHTPLAAAYTYTNVGSPLAAGGRPALSYMQHSVGSPLAAGSRPACTVIHVDVPPRRLAVAIEVRGSAANRAAHPAAPSCQIPPCPPSAAQPAAAAHIQAQSPGSATDATRRPDCQYSEPRHITEYNRIHFRSERRS